ncbi:MAG: hypothetical protein P1U56_23275 [Saprospiraceae bacterium]|nr:hypothetical protein [Saprospiraceae bacterium]
MKKLFFLVIFSVGIFSVSHAQFLTYTLQNSSTTATWNYKMKDAGSGTITSELGILPGQTRSGVVANFGFILEFKAANSNSCGTSQVVPGPTPVVLVPITCTVPTALKYRVDEIIPFVLYDLQLKFG